MPTSDRSQHFRRGSGDGMHEKGDRAQHGKPESMKSVELFNQDPARADWVDLGGGEARSTEEAG
jgi:hypothetical protein